MLQHSPNEPKIFSSPIDFPNQLAGFFCFHAANFSQDFKGKVARFLKSNGGFYA